MLNRPGRPVFGALLAAALSVLGLVGCGEDELVDENYGPLDLAPYFYDGSSASNPTNGLPRQLRPQRGWVNGLRAEYYDFGLVRTSRKRNATTGETTATPDVATVNPMYFFFAANGKPMFSKPVRETRTGLWHMRGGKDLLDTNPRDRLRNGNDRFDRDAPYSVRLRNYMRDRDRNQSADYQRPIIDTSPHEDQRYTGLWEVVEVRAPEGYEPDSIKSWSTLEKALASGEFTRSSPTKAVINCPLVDDRTYVRPSTFAYDRPTPRIEVWYRTKLGSCYLANGWEALGTSDGDQHTLFPYGTKAPKRFNTFDVIAYTIGSGAAAKPFIVSPVGRVFDPRLNVRDQSPNAISFTIRYGNDSITEAVPRRFDSDPPGYRPIRGHWDISVSQDPPYKPGTFKDLAQVDPSTVSLRTTGNPAVPFTRNFPLIGTAIRCTTNDDCAGKNIYIPLECNKAPDDEIEVSDEITNIPGQKKDDLQMLKEGGPRCDVPAKGFGEYCAPGIARCRTNVPSSEVTATTMALTGMFDKEDKQNLDRIYVPSGYSCHANTVGAGYCYQRCDDSATNNDNGKRLAQEITQQVPRADDPSVTRKVTRSYDFRYDSRCGGTKMLGFQCTNNSNPSRLKSCLRYCTSRDPEHLQNAICRQPLQVSLNPDMVGVDIGAGQSCVQLTGHNVTTCAWDPAFEPRNPLKSFVGQSEPKP
jgi:hypothetical protein